MASRSIKNRPGIKKKHPGIGFLVVFTVLFATIVAGGVGVYALGASWIADDLPDYSNAEAYNSAMPTTIQTTTGTVLAKLQLENRQPVALEQVSPYVIKGTIATEDERFYDHGGFDLWGIARAAIVTLTGSGREGASTITQQFVRNTILVNEMDDISLKRKVREMYLAVKVEELYTKDEILRMYLNTINYGSGAHGIQAAAIRYFSKDAASLTLAEAATLIGIPQSPTYNNPLDNPKNCLDRRNLVLDRMFSNGYITQEECDAAKLEAISLIPTEPSVDGIEQYPYIASYVRDLLTDEKGPYKYTTDAVYKGGLTVTVTIDPMMQQEAERAVLDKEARLDAQKSGSAIQGALVSIEPSTGHVKAMVGGNDWEASKVNLATGISDSEKPGRACGSSFKLFTLIAALEAGISPQTMIDCTSPATIANTGYGTSVPALQNIYNINYGTRSIQRAFAVSSNTGFVRLEMSLGIDKVVDVATKMGITSPLNAVPSLTLGTENVTMLDMSSAYAVVANGGVRVDPTPILSITDSQGNVLVDNSVPDTELSVTKSEQVISPEVAFAAAKVMQSVVNTSEGTGTDAYLASGQVVAAKTGTSENYQDISFCGITPQLSTAIWFGDPEYKETLPSSTSAGDVFRQFVGAALYGKELADFPSAADPSYTTYTDTKYNIGGYGYSSSRSWNSGSTNSSESSGSSSTNDEPASGSNAGQGNSSSGGTGTGGGETGGTGGGSTGGTGTGTGGGSTGGTGGATGGTTPTPPG